MDHYQPSWIKIFILLHEVFYQSKHSTNVVPTNIGYMLLNDGVCYLPIPVRTLKTVESVDTGPLLMDAQPAVFGFFLAEDGLDNSLSFSLSLFHTHSLSPHLSLWGGYSPYARSCFDSVSQHWGVGHHSLTVHLWPSLTPCRPCVSPTCLPDCTTWL